MKTPRRASSFGGAKTSKPPPPPSPFIGALVELLRSRNLDIPPGLTEAPPEAYASQSEAVVTMMSRLKDADLVERASKVAGWEKRQAERAEHAWESSPLIRELRRRGLKEPQRPRRVVGAAFSLKKPLAEWTDAEVQDAATAWARLGNA